MCTTNINTLEMDRQVFWQTNYLTHQIKYMIDSRSKIEGIKPSFL